MLQERKSRFRGISAIFCQCCFMTETQVLMTVSNFFGCFSRYHFLEGASLFNSIGSSFIFKWGEGAPRGHQVDGGEFQKNYGLVGGVCQFLPAMGNPGQLLLKMRLRYRCFLVNFEKFLKIPFQKTPWYDCFFIEYKYNNIKMLRINITHNYILPHFVQFSKQMLLFIALGDDISEAAVYRSSSK